MTAQDERITPKNYVRKWHVSDWVRVGKHLIDHGVPELVLYRALFAHPAFNIDDKIRELDISEQEQGIYNLAKFVNEALTIIKWVKKFFPSGSPSGSKISRLSLIMEMVQLTLLFLEKQQEMIAAVRELVGTRDSPPAMFDYWYGPSVRPDPPTRQRDERGRFYYDR